MVKARDLTGQRFGRLVALKKADNLGSKTRWLCKCDCGNEVFLVTGSLVSGNTKSCGCYKVDAVVKLNTTHGMTGSPVYRAWQSMITRCTNENYIEYHRYGDRGISVCDEWRNSFETFYAYMGDRPPGKTLDRIDNDKGYAPGNVRWASYTEQMNNRSTNHLLTLKEAADEFGINYQTLQTRLHAGWRLKEALTSNRVLARMIFSAILKDDKTDSEIARVFNVSPKLIAEYR